MVKRVRAARHYQRRDAQVRLLANHAQPGIRRDLKGSLKHLRALVPTGQALHHARAANWAELKRGINWGHFREVLKAPFARIARLRQASAALGVQKINGAFAQARRRVRFRKDIGDLFNFDLFDSGTAARLRQAQDDLITALEDAARDAIDQIIQFGAINGFGPEEIVDDIRDLIGLNDRYAQAVLNLEATLREDPNLSDEAIQQQVDDYTDRLLDSRADMIAATESSRAANWGLADAYQQAVDRGALPQDAVTKFWQLSLDEKTCEVCLSVVDQNPDGVSVSEDFDSIDGPQDNPPVHPSCFPGDTLVTTGSRITAASKRWYDGNLVVISTASGNELSVTPNHPILTRNGWIAAQFLHVGSDVVRRIAVQGISLSDTNDEQVPTRIEDVAEAFGRSQNVSARPVPLTTEDFHGDGHGSKIAVVWANGKLRDGLNPARMKHRAQNSLMLGNMKLFAHHCLRAFNFFLNRMLPSPSSSMGCPSLVFDLCPAHAGYSERLRLALAARRESKLSQPTSDHATADREMLGKRPDRFALMVKRDEIRRDRSSLQFAGPLYSDAVTFERPTDPVLIDAHLARDILAGKAGPVELDAVIDVSLRVFSGHVFNLETTGGFYIAEGIIAHNCRCSIEYVTDLDKVPDTADEE